MDQKIIEDVQRRILDPKGYAQLARNDIELVLNAYHAVMRENREELVVKMVRADAEAVKYRDGQPHGMRAAFDTLFKDNSNE